MRAILVLVVLVGATANLGQAAEQESCLGRDSEFGAGMSEEQKCCVEAAAGYIAGIQVVTPIMALVTESRRHYPNVMELIKDDVPTSEWEDAMVRLGPQAGCKKLVEDMLELESRVECYTRLKLDTHENSALAVAEFSFAARNVIEAYLACQSSS